MVPLQVRVDDVSVSRSMREFIEGRVYQALAKVRHAVLEAHLNIEDVNGPARGGVDKQAKLVVRCRRRKPLVLEDRDSQLGVLIHRLMDRLEATVIRRTEKQKRARRKG
jgi:ribosome-associated translation inhibitor RaiA